MKWFLICLAGGICLGSVARGDAASDLYQKGTDAEKGGDLAGAVAAYDQIIQDYPNFGSIDDVRLAAGIDYNRLGDSAKAIDRLAKVAARNASPSIRGISLFYTGLAQFALAGKADNPAAAKVSLNQAVTSFTDLLAFITANPTPDNLDLREDTFYYRAFVQFQREDFMNAEKDLLQLVQAPEYASSLRRPDYLLLLGSLYASETSAALAARKPTDPVDPIHALAAKAIDAFDKVSSDPNALIQANEADMREAEVLTLVAPLDLPATDGYVKALAAYQKVLRKDDLVPRQEQRMDQLKAKAQELAQTPGGNTRALGRVIDREQAALNALKSEPDPIIQALINIGETYNAMKQSDEARTVLRRLAKAPLTEAQQQQVDFDLIYSYALGGHIEKADAALTDYLAKHPGNKQAESISYQLAANLTQRKDYEGALTEANRSLKDFPNGSYAGAALSLKAEALKSLGRFKEADDTLTEAANRPGQGLLAFQNQLTLGQTKAAQGDLPGALAIYQKVKDNSAAGELQSAGDAYYIQTLQTLQRYDEVIAESKIFATKYPTSKALPGVLVLGALAMDRKNDPGAVPALQDIAKKFPGDPSASYALFYVITIYQRQGKVPEMIQAGQDLRKAFPTAYDELLQAADSVSGALAKQKKFDLAVAEYNGLIDAPKPEVAANARNKVGALWLAAAKVMVYQSLQNEADRAEAVKRLSTSEQSYVSTLKGFPDQLAAVGDAFQGLNDDLLVHRSWGLLKDSELEAYLGTATASLTTPEMATRIELAKAGLVFVEKEGAKQYPAALDRFKKAVDANPTLALTRQETNQFGELLIANKDYDRATTVYTNLLNGSDPKNQLAQADALYGLGAVALAQGNLEPARDFFLKMKALPGGAAWHPHILEADYGIALAQEHSANPADNASAKATYAGLMTNPQSNYALQARAMLGYGRLLEKAGHGLQAPGQQDIEYALHYYQQVNTFFGPSVSALSAEGLFDSGLLYAKNGKTAEAQAQYQLIVKTYGTTAPDWAAKAQAELAKSGG